MNYNYKCIVSKNGKRYYKNVRGKWKRISNAVGMKAEKGKKKYGMPVKTRSGTERDPCPVCYSKKFITLDCGHSICADCGKDIKTGVCPICRNEGLKNLETGGYMGAPGYDPSNPRGRMAIEEHLRELNEEVESRFFDEEEEEEEDER